MSKRLMLVASVAVALLAAYSLNAGDKDKEKTKVKCPVSGKPAKKSQSVKYKGGKVFFCCGNCPKAFKKNTEKFAAKANAQLVTTGQAKQLCCPLTKKKLNKDTAIKVGGAKVAFCCNGCKGKTLAKKKGDERINFVFNDKRFDKAFKVKKAEKKKK